LEVKNEFAVKIAEEYTTAKGDKKTRDVYYTIGLEESNEKDYELNSYVRRLCKNIGFRMESSGDVYYNNVIISSDFSQFLSDIALELTQAMVVQTQLVLDSRTHIVKKHNGAGEKEIKAKSIKHNALILILKELLTYSYNKLNDQHNGFFSVITDKINKDIEYHKMQNEENSHTSAKEKEKEDEDEFDDDDAIEEDDKQDKSEKSEKSDKQNKSDKDKKEVVVKVTPVQNGGARVQGRGSAK